MCFKCTKPGQAEDCLLLNIDKFKKKKKQKVIYATGNEIDKLKVRKTPSKKMNHLVALQLYPMGIQKKLKYSSIDQFYIVFYAELSHALNELHHDLTSLCMIIRIKRLLLVNVN